MIDEKILCQAAVQLAAIPLFIYGLLFESHWLVLSVFMYFVFRYIGITVFYHRMLSHGAGINNISLPTKIVLLLIAFYGSISTPLQMVGIHLQHHKNPDSNLDPHSPLFMGKRVLFTFLWKPILDRAAIVACGKVKLYEFFRLHFKKLLGAMFVLLLVIDYHLLLFGWLLPAGLTIWSIGYGVYASHKGTSAVVTMGWFRDVVLCAGDCHKHDKHHRNPSDVSNEGLITYTISALRNI